MSERAIADRQALNHVSARRSAADTADAGGGAVDGIACRLGDASCAAAHAATVSRSASGQRAAVYRSLLRLQRQYGNRYVGQVLRQAGAVEGDIGVMDGVERSIDQARGGGHGMDHGTRTRMESAFGADFSGVRIHTDSRADGLSQSLSARAFTTGRDVFFRQGEYNPGLSSGRELLAHELTHVVQQNGDGLSRKMTVSEPGDAREIEADQMARVVMQQEHTPSVDRQMVPPEEEEEQQPLAAKRATDFLQRQPEAPTSQEEEEKKKMLQAKLDSARVSRREPTVSKSEQEADRIWTYATTSTYQLSARIRQAAGPASMVGIPAPNSQLGRSAFGREADSVEEGQTQPETVTEEEGSVMVEESDSIGAPLVYNPSIANDSVPPGGGEFGVTRTNPTVSGIGVTHDTAAAAFNVAATVVNTVKWSVHSLGRTDIPNENAPAITSANYTTAASDLTPNMTSDNGRPPRTQFWARDLTERHERFHANERANTYGRPAFDFARNWLTSQSATDEAGVRSLVNRIPAKMFESYNASYVPGKESRAYGDGAALYRARANAITAKGASGGYGGGTPAPSPSP